MLPESVHPQPSTEQVKAQFLEQIGKIRAATDRRQLEEATETALRLMLRRAVDAELLRSLLQQTKKIISSLPEIIEGEQAKALLKAAIARCMELINRGRKLRAPRLPKPGAVIDRRDGTPHRARNVILTVSLIIIFALSVVWLLVHEWH
jgi:hypothetical protein